MNEIKYVTGKKTKTIEAIASWSELSEKQYLDIVKKLPVILTDGISDKLLLSLLSINKRTFKLFSPAQKYYLKKSFDFLKEKPNPKKLMIESFRIGRKQYIGFQPNFGNTTWEEFTFADQYFLLGKYEHAIAVLYREKKKKDNKLSDIRIPFSVYGMPDRLEALKKLDKNIIVAISLNYASLRENFLTKKYRYVFETSNNKEAGNSNFSWIDVHRNILSENFFEEKKFLKSNLHIVLHRLNHVIEDNRKRKK